VPVVIRDRPFHSTEHGDPLPLVTVSPGKEDDGDYFMTEGAGGGVEFRWPIVVALFQSKDGSVEDPAATQWRIDRRWNAFQACGRTRLTAAPTVMDFRYDPDPHLDLAGLDQVLKVSLQLFTYRSTEGWGGAG